MNNMSNARQLSCVALVDINKKGSYSNLTLNKYFSNNELSSVDRALFTAIVYGVLDRKITIDYILSQFIKTSINKLKPLTLEALRIAIFQMLYMDKIPVSAAINESVNIVKFSKEKFNASFVNAVLRNVSRSKISLPEDNSIPSLSVKYSCPAWIIESFIADYGLENTLEFLEHSLKAPKVFIRVNKTKTTVTELQEMLKAEGINTAISSYPDSLCIEGNINFNDCKLFSNGYFHVQDIASQTVADKLEAKNGDRILDMCSAPGGKAFTTAENINNTGEIIACDIYDSRVSLIRSGAKRLGLANIKPIKQDATIYNADLGKFDIVLCDVVCSGLGVIGRKPEIKYKTENDFENLSEIQYSILNNASKYLADVGKIVYSTCTLRKAENELVVQRFLNEHAEFELKFEHTFMPHLDNTDGFYCAVITKSR